jgi:hypothetical protein
MGLYTGILQLLIIVFASTVLPTFTLHVTAFADKTVFQTLRLFPEIPVIYNRRNANPAAKSLI